MSGTWGKREGYEQVQKFKQGLVPDSIFDKLKFEQDQGFKADSRF